MVNKNDFNAKVLIEVIGDTTLTCVECSAHCDRSGTQTPGQNGKGSRLNFHGSLCIL